MLYVVDIVVGKNWILADMTLYSLHKLYFLTVPLFPYFFVLISLVQLKIPILVCLPFKTMVITTESTLKKNGTKHSIKHFTYEFVPED